MRKRTLPVVLAIFAFFSIGCKKGQVNEPEPPLTADSYLPVTAGSSWDYFVLVAGYKDTISIK